MFFLFFTYILKDRNPDPTDDFGLFPTSERTNERDIGNEQKSAPREYGRH